MSKVRMREHQVRPPLDAARAHVSGVSASADEPEPCSVRDRRTPIVGPLVPLAAAPAHATKALPGYSAPLPPERMPSVDEASRTATEARTIEAAVQGAREIVGKASTGEPEPTHDETFAAKSWPDLFMDFLGRVEGFAPDGAVAATRAADFERTLVRRETDETCEADRDATRPWIIRNAGTQHATTTRAVFETCPPPRSSLAVAVRAT